MPRLFRSQKKMTGLPPGTLVHVGRQMTDRVTTNVISYNTNGLQQEQAIEELTELARIKESPPVTWINVTGLHQIQTIETIGAVFGLHPLLLEDILNTDQRPKIEQHEGMLLLIVKLLHWQPEQDDFEAEQVSLVLGDNFLLTFQEQEKDVFDPVRQRIRTGQGRVIQRGPDYLAYRLLDVIVDHYFVLLENLGEEIEEVEEELIADPTPATLQRIHRLKRELLFIRRSVWPLREVIGGLQRGESPLFAPDTLIFLRDVYEHTIQVIDTVETFRDIVSGLLDIYLSSLSNKMNEVMKMLTVIATIFIPLTFITSLYGMNFENIPELSWPWGYPVAWLIMMLIGGTMLYYFRRKNWL